MRENEHLKEKLAQIEASSQICFHGKNLPPPSDQGNLLRGIANYSSAEKCVKRPGTRVGY